MSDAYRAPRIGTAQVAFGVLGRVVLPHVSDPRVAIWLCGLCGPRASKISPVHEIKIAIDLLPQIVTGFLGTGIYLAGLYLPRMLFVRMRQIPRSDFLWVLDFFA